MSVPAETLVSGAAPARGRSRIRTAALVCGVAAALLLAAHLAFLRYAREVFIERRLSFRDETPLAALKAISRAGQASEQDPAFAPLAPARAFEEITPFDDEAHSWSTAAGLYGGAGVTVFDANGDGRLDVYLCHDGQNWTRATDANGVLETEPRYQANVLYLNLGTDPAGNPAFGRLDLLAERANDTFVEEELLVENYLFPRRTTADSKKRPARAANVALAADLDSDGRPDLLVGNSPTGSGWSHPETQQVLARFVSPVGRQARHSNIPLASMANYLLAGYRPKQSLDDQRGSSRGREYEGANSLFLNLGDRDGDGLPEWRDASREAGVEGSRSTHGLAAADVDLDGDLDLYEANTMDPDMWPGNSRFWAGGANALYLNQLAETGRLTFVERGAAMNVDSVFDGDYPQPTLYRIKRFPLLPVEYALAAFNLEAYHPEYLVIDGERAEPAEISWATVFQDVNQDGYPDLWVANDLSHLRLYINQQGRRFVLGEHPRSRRTGFWMTFAASDLNGDLAEDLVVGNLGGGVLNHAMVSPDPYQILDPVVMDSRAFSQFFLGRHDNTHLLLDGRSLTREMRHKVRHSKVLPPETSFRNNYRQKAVVETKLPPFDPDSLDPYEFAWGMTAFDAQNDGRPDVYYLGCLVGRGGGLFPVSGTGPGRFLVNATRPGGEVRLVDLTAEHHLFDIEELQYDRLESEGYIYRRAPTQNWDKRDMVYSYDRSTWISQGPSIQERVTNQDMLQTAEQGRSAVAADLNADGYDDLILTNLGGYDSRSSKAVNLKAMIDGRPQVIPAPDFNYPSLTNFEPGRTRVFLNRYSGSGWLAVRLIDDSPGSFNRDAVGARVVVNGRHLRVKRAGDGGFIGNVLADLRFGLGTERARKIEIHWPDRARTVTRLDLPELAGGVLIVSKSRSGMEWQPAEGYSALERTVPSK